VNVKIIDLIAAARPNFMKVAPLYRALKAEDSWCRPRLVHTGQHYDANMSEAFLRELGLPEPEVHLGVGSGTHAEQTGGVMIAYEAECLRTRPDWVVVVGDVNSTIACTLAAKKLGIPVAHLEAGLRSGDRSMPEELNRVATDALADLLWTPSADADANLRREGIPASRIELVGNIMIDSLEMMRPAIESRRYAERLRLARRGYGIVTLHRPGNVDDAPRLRQMVELILEASGSLPVVFPVHPRTRQRLKAAGLLPEFERARGLILTEPLGYTDFMSLVFDCRYVMTDSGGIQEETTYLGIPCLTLRENTERPITIKQGTNRLVRPETALSRIRAILSGALPARTIPPLWDGAAAARVVRSLKAAAFEAVRPSRSRGSGRPPSRAGGRAAGTPRKKGARRKRARKSPSRRARPARRSMR
jgi:UDP-N-acetylglucosamine 2-epimerase (non-hydrolysing)